MESKLDEKQSLKIIEEMIYKGKRNLSESSIFYLIWGWAVLVAGLAEYLLLEVWTYQYHWLTWPVAMIVAALLSMYKGAKLRKRRPYVTFTDTAMKYIWIGFILYLFIVLFTSVRIGWAATYMLIVGLYGLGTFISGGVLQFRPLIVGGILSMVLGLVALIASDVFQHFPNILLLLCLSIVVSYLIPGYMLRAKKEADAA